MRKLFIKELKDVKITLLDKLEDIIFYNKFSIFLQHLFRFIKRLPKWIKVAWNNEDWDYGYLYDLIELKLKDFLKAQEEDTWHLGTERRIKEIKITLARLDRYRNWTKYYDYPMEDIIHVKIEDPKYGTCYRMEHTNPENEKQRLGAIDFEQHNYDKFWKDFMRWHQNWWT